MAPNDFDSIRKQLEREEVERQRALLEIENAEREKIRLQELAIEESTSAKLLDSFRYIHSIVRPWEMYVVIPFTMKFGLGSESAAERDVEFKVVREGIRSNGFAGRKEYVGIRTYMISHTWSVSYNFMAGIVDDSQRTYVREVLPIDFVVERDGRVSYLLSAPSSHNTYYALAFSSFDACLKTLVRNTLQNNWRSFMKDPKYLEWNSNSPWHDMS